MSDIWLFIYLFQSKKKKSRSNEKYFVGNGVALHIREYLLILLLFSFGMENKGVINLIRWQLAIEIPQGVRNALNY